MFYIYKITNIKTGHIYIGQSINPKSRFRSHKSYARNGGTTKLCNAMRSYGFDNFNLTIIAEAPTKKIINILEREYISTYNTINDGYNICPGGEGISSEMASIILASKEARTKTSERLKKQWENKEYRKIKTLELKTMWTPEKIAELSIACKKAWTYERKEKRKETLKRLWSNPEYIKKQSEAKKKHWDNPEYRAKMSKMSKDKADAVFLRKLAKENWKDPNRARRMSQGRKNNNISVICLETLKTYKRLMDAERDTGIKRRCIALNIRGETYRAGGKHWIYYSDTMTKEKANVMITDMEKNRKQRKLEIWAKRKNAQH